MFSPGSESTRDIFRRGKKYLSMSITNYDYADDAQI